VKAATIHCNKTINCTVEQENN